jgi:predicted HTH transcriptional regulator
MCSLEGKDRINKMQHKRIFISSTQSEFIEERKLLAEYLRSDALLCKFFDVFLFENLPANNEDSGKVYLDEMKQCDIYIGLFGKEYGYENTDGISPTEREFNCAVKNHKIKLVFVTNHKDTERHPKELKLIKKAEKYVVRKKFSNDFELKTAVYNSLVRFLEENEYIRTLPFDVTFNRYAGFDDLDEEKIKNFVYIAHKKRAFPFTHDTDIKTILTHLNLIDNDRITNAAILLFGKKPQRYFITSEVRCAHFHGYDKVKPIPNYQVYKGDIFQLITQAVNFVLSNIAVSTSARDKGVVVDVRYELPVSAVTEAIVNAVAHRDYTSNASVQVMLFKDRLEVWNPGHLPYGMTVEKLKKKHTSIPVNPLIAEPLYLAGTIERMGTGTGDIIKQCKKAGLSPPEFVEEEDFRVVLWRNRQSIKQAPIKHPSSTHQAPIKHPSSTHQAPIKHPSNILQLLSVIKGEMTRQEIQSSLDLADRVNLRSAYLQPAIEQGLVAIKFPKKPTHPEQRYYLTKKGMEIKNKTLLHNK